jgi:hypothetical protein
MAVSSDKCVGVQPLVLIGSVESVLIYIYRQRRHFILFSSAQQRHMFRPVQPYSGITVYDLKTNEMRPKYVAICLTL